MGRVWWGDEEETNLKLEKCGLFVDVDNHFLAASPDGLIGENSVLEVKCPFSGRMSKIQEGKLFPHLEFRDDMLKLKKVIDTCTKCKGKWLLPRKKRVTL